MSTAKKLAWIAAGCVLSIAGAVVAVAINELLIPSDVAQGSPGMVAFGDMIIFVLAAGLLGLVPTWFLLRLFVEKAPRALLAIEILVAALGPASWLTVVYAYGSGPMPNQTPAAGAVVGLLIAFVAIPRMVAGPVLLVIEAATFVLVRGPVARGFLAAAMLMDLVPLGWFALHMASRH